MAIQHALPQSESHLLRCDDHVALVALMTPMLPNSVLVQLFGTPFGVRQVFSLYAVYREDSMTFDAIIRFEPGVEARLSKGDLLQRFVARSSFDRAVLQPLASRVRSHFAPLRR